MLKLKECCLYLHDLEKAKTFYNNVLELPVISFVADRHVFFRAGEAVFLCFNPDVTREESTLPPHFSEGNQHVAFEVSTNSDYDLWKEKVTQKGINIICEYEWKPGIRSFYFHDFEQNVIEIVMKGVWEDS